MNGIYWIYWICIGYIGFIVHTGNIPPVKWINETKKTQKEGGRVKIEPLVANPIEKSRF